MKNIMELVAALMLIAFTSNAFAVWKCYSRDAENHFWMSRGMSQENAQRIAVIFCKSSSPAASTCAPRQCLEEAG